MAFAVGLFYGGTYDYRRNRSRSCRNCCCRDIYRNYYILQKEKSIMTEQYIEDTRYIGREYTTNLGSTGRLTAEYFQELTRQFWISEAYARPRKKINSRMAKDK